MRPVSRDDHLFLGQRGVGLSVNRIEGLVRLYGQRAGIADLTPHQLRHQFVTTTMIYTRASEDDLRAAVARLRS